MEESPMQPFPDASTLSRFIGRVAQQLRADGALDAAEQLEAIRTSGWTTSSEWLGELGQTIRTIETHEVSPSVRKGFRRILEAVHVVWPKL
jgi:neutral trehalase